MTLVHVLSGCVCFCEGQTKWGYMYVGGPNFESSLKVHMVSLYFTLIYRRIFSLTSLT